jgi:hypothetical protein
LGEAPCYEIERSWHQVSGAKTRARVLRAVAENEQFTRAHFNRAFVLMQYFGYLKESERRARQQL